MTNQVNSIQRTGAYQQTSSVSAYSSNATYTGGFSAGSFFNLPALLSGNNTQVGGFGGVVMPTSTNIVKEGLLGSTFDVGGSWNYSPSAPNGDVRFRELFTGMDNIFGGRGTAAYYNSDIVNTGPAGGGNLNSTRPLATGSTQMYGLAASLSGNNTQVGGFGGVVPATSTNKVGEGALGSTFDVGGSWNYSPSVPNGDVRFRELFAGMDNIFGGRGNAAYYNSDVNLLGPAGWQRS